MTMIEDWARTKADATKLLGKEGELPSERADINDAMVEADKTLTVLRKTRDTLESNCVAYQNGADKVMNAAQAYLTICSRSDFGLDPKNPEQAKKIASVKKAVDGFLTSLVKDAKRQAAGIDKFIASLADFRKDLLS